MEWSAVCSSFCSSSTWRRPKSANRSKLTHFTCSEVLVLSQSLSLSASFGDCTLHNFVSIPIGSSGNNVSSIQCFSVSFTRLFADLRGCFLGLCGFSVYYESYRYVGIGYCHTFGKEHRHTFGRKSNSSDDWTCLLSFGNAWLTHRSLD